MKASLDNPDVVVALCDRIIAGEAISVICQDADMPSARTVYTRMSSDDQFRAVIARAREAQQDAEADKCIDLADNATAEDWQVVKLRIWARQWRAGKLAPKKYGEKLDMNLSGSITTLPEETLDARIAELLRKAGTGGTPIGTGTTEEPE